jgi:alkanesulfonate monooxygenase SsuD/methylene tetrahydromethanopterin reductase-like flavin-dependent oxidoreductase (luciferase family)
MRHALSLPNMGDPSRLVEIAVAADANDWDAVFLWDHLHFDRTMDVEVHDPWVALGAIAVSTRRVALGTLVTPVARRRPWKLAKEVVTLDHLSGGRAILGVGLGFPGDDEFTDFGDEGDDRRRAELLDEGLVVLEGCLSGQPFHHDGPHFTVDVHLLPGCVQRPRPPIWVAGMWPNRRPMFRAQRFDAFAPVSADGNPLTPDITAEIRSQYGNGTLVIPRAEGTSVAEYERAGADWLVESRWPVDSWADELLTVASGPPR